MISVTPWQEILNRCDRPDVVVFHASTLRPIRRSGSWPAPYKRPIAVQRSKRSNDFVRFCGCVIRTYTATGRPMRRAHWNAARRPTFASERTPHERKDRPNRPSSPVAAGLEPSQTLQSATSLRASGAGSPVRQDSGHMRHLAWHGIVHYKPAPVGFTHNRPLMLRFSDAGRARCETKCYARLAGVRKPSEKENTANDAPKYFVLKRRYPILHQ